MQDEITDFHFHFFSGCQIPDAGFQMPDAGYRMPDAGYRMQDKGKLFWNNFYTRLISPSLFYLDVALVTL
jgi:hypothetical protein